MAKVGHIVMVPLDWLEERSGIVGGTKYFLFRKVPSDVNWFQTLGSATLTAFLVQLGTGVVLAMYYKPTPDHAYESIRNITHDVTLGWLVRGMHRWGASVFIILLFLHMGRVFLFGAYKCPRELNWIVGVLILPLALLMGFTGYLLPWDQTAYWATVVGINLNGTGPFVGPFLSQFLRGGDEIGANTLTIFYALHMLLLPGALIALITLHLYLVVRLGVVSPPWSEEEAGRERPEQFKRYKEDVETRGKAFHPYAMFHDTVMSLVVVTVIVGLACVWYFTADEASEPDGASTSGSLGVLYEEKADPGTTSFIPRPDWYFYFLFYLLRIFKWPDTVVLGTVGIPTIALILLLALPFLDRRQERRLSRRPVAVIEENNIPEGEAQEGAQLFAESGCTNCHTYLGSGVANLGAPDLSGVGNEMDAARLQAYISNPREFGNQVMPVYGETLSEEQLGQIAAFLEASKGSSGG